MIQEITKHQKITSAIVLKKIKDILSKHAFKKTISLDTITLSLNIKPDDIIPLIHELEQQGAIMRRIPTTNSRRTHNLGEITLL